MSTHDWAIQVCRTSSSAAVNSSMQPAEPSDGNVKVSAQLELQPVAHDSTAIPAQHVHPPRAACASSAALHSSAAALAHVGLASEEEMAIASENASVDDAMLASQGSGNASSDYDNVVLLSNSMDAVAEAEASNSMSHESAAAEVMEAAKLGIGEQLPGRDPEAKNLVETWAVYKWEYADDTRSMANFVSATYEDVWWLRYERRLDPPNPTIPETEQNIRGGLVSYDESHQMYCFEWTAWQLDNGFLPTLPPPHWFEGPHKLKGQAEDRWNLFDADCIKRTGEVMKGEFDVISDEVFQGNSYYNCQGLHARRAQ